MELEHRKALEEGERPTISTPFSPSRPQMTIRIADEKDNIKSPRRAGTGLHSLRRVASLSIRPTQRRNRKPKLLLLREEKDRFDAMRHIQQNTVKFKRWYSLFASITAFGLLWCVGALVFWRCERLTQDMTYFQALYFCYVSLLTIGKSSPTGLAQDGYRLVCAANATLRIAL